jgi:hypothetical protein
MLIFYADYANRHCPSWFYYWGAILPVWEPVMRLGVHLTAQQEMRMYQGASNFRL